MIRLRNGSEERALEHAERNVCEECVGRDLRDYVSDWVFEEEGGEWD